MKTSDNLNEIFAALSKAQGEFKIAIKDSENPFFKSKYANFESVVDAARPALLKHGLSFIQVPAIINEKMFLVTRVCHSSGQWIEGEYPINPVKQDPQAFGSATTYAKRYSLAAVLGIVDSEDDDGEAATGRSKDDNQSKNNATSKQNPDFATKEEKIQLFKGFESVGMSEKAVLDLVKKEANFLLKTDLDKLRKIGIEMKNKMKNGAAR